MGELRRGRRPAMVRSHAELWVWPGAGALLALVAAYLLAAYKPEEDTLLAELAWPGDIAAASATMQTVATASVTALTLTLTLTVVALQLASQQFSPRLLRDFMRDRVTKTALATLIAAFVFAVTTLRTLDDEEDPPALALIAALVLAVAALAALLAFINHMARRLRVDTMMLSSHDEARRAIEESYPERGDPHRSPDELALDPSAGRLVAAQRSGFVVSVTVPTLVRRAAQDDVVLRLEVRPGDHVVDGSPVATVWRRDGGVVSDDLAEKARATVAAGIRLGYERTVEQDAAFGFRQLTDIAVRALSPGINDPVTAGHAVGYVSDLLVALLGRGLGPTLHTDDDAVGRVVVGDRDLRYYLDLTCGPVRRYGGGDPTVLAALLRMLRDVAAQARDDGQRAEVERQVALVLEHVPDSWPDVDAALVRDLAERVRAAFRGDLGAAYRDRSGETRSI